MGQTTHQWNHPDWNTRTDEWNRNSSKCCMSSLPMKRYLKLRIFEANLRWLTSRKYGGVSTKLPFRRCRGGINGPAPPIPPGRIFHWTKLYDSDGQHTFPGSQMEGSPWRVVGGRVDRTQWGKPSPYFERYSCWCDLRGQRHTAAG